MVSRVLLGSVAEGLGTPGLRRLQAAWAASALGSWVFFVALAVYAYYEGGAAAVGAAALVRMVPAGLAAPLTGLIAQRHPQRDVLLGGLVLRAAAAAAMAAAVVVDVPLGVVFALAAAFTVCATAYRPAQTGLLIELAGTPGQAGAATALRTGIDNGAFLAGSLLGGALLAAFSSEICFAVVAGLHLLAVVPVLLVGRDPVPASRPRATAGPSLGALLSGILDLARVRDVRDVVGLQTGATFIEGMIDVLVVVVADDVLNLGHGGVGWLNAAWGLGGLAGGAVAVVLLRRGRLTAGIAAGGVLVGASVALLAVLDVPAAALVLLVGIGVGYAVIEAASLALLQRHTSDEVLTRAFTAMDSGYWLATGVGAIAGSAILSLVGTDAALVLTGAALPLLVALRWRGLARFEARAAVPDRELRVLRAVPAFAALPPATVENLARRLERRELTTGDVVTRRGEQGDELFVVSEGTLAVTDAADGGAVLEPGDVFGEAELLHDAPRSATVTARGPGVLFVLDRDAFLSAIRGPAHTARTIGRLASAQLESA